MSLSSALVETLLRYLFFFDPTKFFPCTSSVLVAGPNQGRLLCLVKHPRIHNKCCCYRVAQEKLKVMLLVKWSASVSCRTSSRTKNVALRSAKEDEQSITGTLVIKCFVNGTVFGSIVV